MTIVLLIVLGLVCGSFINALVWRLHQQFEIKDETKIKPSKEQRHKLERLSIIKGRSMCPQCQHQLAWNDLVPLFSWLSLRGKCRYCRTAISAQYPLVELGTALVFALSYLLWPFDLSTIFGVALLSLWLIMTVILVALLVYDARWYILPNKLTFPLIGLAAVYGLIRTLGLEGLDPLQAVWQLSLGMLSVGGLYYALYAVSDGKWVGGGDAKLGIAMGLILGWPAGLLAVFLANIIGLVWIIPGLVTKRLSGKSQVPFGPFLIISLFISVWFGQAIIDWYLDNLLMI